MSTQETADNIILQVRDVTKTFSRPVLKKISLSVSSGQCLLICGVNGAGKSTLLKIMAGLLGPDSGSVYVAGKCLHLDSEQVKADIGIIMHQSLVYSDLTVLENLDFFASLYGVPHRHKRIDQLLEQVGLTPFRYDLASVLSRGLLQRLSIARAMIHQPRLILADEPFTGLDIASVDYLLTMLNAFWRQGGAVVLTTHDISLGLRCANRAAVIDRSKIVLDRSIDALDTAQFTADYLRYAREPA